MKPKILKTKEDLYFPCSTEFSVDENPYETLMVDLTQRCNIDCNVCFNPVRSNRFDYSLDYFQEVCERLPNPVNFKIVGGEPTMHPNFFEFLRIANRTGHRSYFSSNGLKFLDDDFMEELASLDFGFSAGLTMDGGFSSPESEHVYEVINGRPMLENKLKALAQLKKYKIKRTVLNAILIKDLNEFVVKDLIDLAEQNSDIVRYIHFRNLAQIGDWIDSTPLTMDEMKGLMGEHFDKVQMKDSSVYEVVCRPEEGNFGTCCNRFRPNKRLQISLIDFASKETKNCPFKGKLIDEKFVTQGNYEHMWATNEALTKLIGPDYGLNDIGVKVEK